MNAILNPVRAEAALRAAGAFRPFPPAADRATWGGIRAALEPDEAAAWLARAEQAAAAPADDRSALAALAVAVCLFDESRFLGPLFNCAWAICEESAWWAWPGPADPAAPQLDGRAAMTALALAELDALLGAALPPALAARLRAEVNRRVLAPFMSRHDFGWMFSASHEAAVCVAGAVGAALHLEPDPARLAEVVARGLWALDGGPQQFAPCGWARGLGAWALLAHLLAARTGGRVDPLADSAGLARLPLLARLSPGVYAGCPPADGPAAPLLSWLAQRFDQPDLARLAPEQRAAPASGLPWALRGLLWRPGAASAVPPELPARDWDQRFAWMTARFAPSDPGALALAVLGGCGAAVCFGGDLLIADVPPPLAGGQPAQPDAAAVPLERQFNPTFDFMSLELKNAYPPEAGLLSLRRVAALHRTPPHGWVELADGVLFDDAPRTLTTALVARGGAALAPGVAVLDGQRSALRVEYDPEQVSARLEPGAGLSRVEFAFREPRRSGAIRLKIEPVL